MYVCMCVFICMYVCMYVCVRVEWPEVPCGAGRAKGRRRQSKHAGQETKRREGRTLERGSRPAEKEKGQGSI